MINIHKDDNLGINIHKLNNSDIKMINIHKN